MAKLYGFSSESSLAIDSVAERRPVTDGSSSTVKLVEPLAATVVAGCAVTVKSAAAAPLILTAFAPSVRAIDPMFATVKVFEIVPLAAFTLPKSVWSAKSGVVSPSAISILLPLTAISGFGAA